MRYSTGSFSDDDGRLLLRYTSASGGNFYSAGFASPSGTSELDVYKTVAGSRSRVCGTRLPATSHTYYWVRAQVVDSGGIATIRVKAWKDGTGEPAWQLTCTDSGPLCRWPGGRQCLGRHRRLVDGSFLGR